LVCASPALRYPSPNCDQGKARRSAQAADFVLIHCSRSVDDSVDRSRVMFAKSTEARMQEPRPPCRLLRSNAGTDVVMSGIEESGQDSRHGDIDANDPGCVKTRKLAKRGEPASHIQQN